MTTTKGTPPGPDAPRSGGAQAAPAQGPDARSRSSRTAKGWFPPSWPARIRALTEGRLNPVEPRRAATVLLLRDAPGGPQLHLLRRSASMAFGAGAYAYPGGGVDPRDERPVRWAGPEREVWGGLLGLDPVSAQAVVCAAVRETFEESGVLLAGPDASSVVADTSGDGWEADRRALVGRELSFADFLARRDLVLRSDLLGPWARWITPEFEERRYDTWFFLAALPAGQRTRDVSGEADRVAWLSAGAAVAGYDRGELLMMPPTIATLRALLPYATVADAFASCAGRDMTPVLARAELVGDEVVLRWPGHEEFTRHVERGGATDDGAVPGHPHSEDPTTPARGAES
ncbi:MULTISPECIES: NUDIX hydrolase [Streptomycetaceae]|uniref:Nudix hydrolase domain-containing protein n=1 Tax=Streptantibioticus cattleyicolor (strain ATCC 35852 / DSM 46488 / JCM 4925 / NBRC 14057 / NRRL 8057) TaxID=1003195 RepID=F8JP89_STREN|nr:MULTISPECIES: NUDIX hydrolase [Streptomycetaceae]AEW95244.1 hypothetical protein SCATT_28730 [Streptantibioticus cattleyicolor NRRL 8057 = DSM 46488]MYS59824.1 NUDIX hydrolase [Streptomyces sp. SID5468]CCB75588.1 NUDIX hydrolase [Streptantibioticus cattleyicolor NRRL 8057 = DSM 46488]